MNVTSEMVRGDYDVSPEEMVQTYWMEFAHARLPIGHDKYQRLDPDAPGQLKWLTPENDVISLTAIPIEGRSERRMFGYYSFSLGRERQTADGSFVAEHSFMGNLRAPHVSVVCRTAGYGPQLLSIHRDMGLVASGVVITALMPHDQYPETAGGRLVSEKLGPISRARFDVVSEDRDRSYGYKLKVRNARSFQGTLELPKLEGNRIFRVSQDMHSFNSQVLESYGPLFPDGTLPDLFVPYMRLEAELTQRIDAFIRFGPPIDIDAILREREALWKDAG